MPKSLDAGGRACALDQPEGPGGSLGVASGPLDRGRQALPVLICLAPFFLNWRIPPPPVAAGLRSPASAPAPPSQRSHTHIHSRLHACLLPTDSTVPSPITDSS